MTLYLVNESLSVLLAINADESTITCQKTHKKIKVKSKAAVFLLELLFIHVGEVVDYETIREKVIKRCHRTPGNDPKQTQTIRQIKGECTKALAEFGLAEIIHNEHNRGYRIGPGWHTYVDTCDHRGLLKINLDRTMELADELPVVIHGESGLGFDVPEPVLDRQHAHFSNLSQHLYSCTHSPQRQPHRSKLQQGLVAFGRNMLLAPVYKAPSEQSYREVFRVNLEAVYTDLCIWVTHGGTN